MNTDKEQKLQEGEGGKEAFLLKQETHAIIGCAFEVLNELGHGLNEKCYENSLVVEFALRNIPFSQQRQFEVLYKKNTSWALCPGPNRLRAGDSGCQGYRPNHRS